MSENNTNPQWRVLNYLHDRFLEQPFNISSPDQISRAINLPEEQVRRIVNGAILENLVVADHYTDDGTPIVRINAFGLQRLRDLESSDNALPFGEPIPIRQTEGEQERSSSGSGINWVKWSAIFGGIAVVLIALGLVIPYFNHPSIENSNIANTTYGTTVQSNSQSGGITAKQITINNTANNATTANSVSGNVVQSNHQSGGVIANSIINSPIYESSSQPSARIALINFTDVTTSGEIIIPIAIKDQYSFKGKILLSGALPSDGMIYAKLIKANLPSYNNTLFTLMPPSLIQPIPPKYADHVLNLTIPFEIATIPLPSKEYTNRTDINQYEIQGGSATFQFNYKSVQNDYQSFNFTEPLAIMVKGCIDEHNKDTPCEKPAPPIPESISVDTDKTSYNRDNTVTIHGIVNSIIPNQFVIIQIQYHLGDLITKRSITPNPDGTYSYQLPLSSEFSDGEYVVLANYGSAQSQTTFIVNYPSHT